MCDMKRSNILKALFITGILAASSVYVACKNSLETWNPENKEAIVQTPVSSGSNTYGTLKVKELFASEARTINPVVQPNDFKKIYLTGIKNKGTETEEKVKFASYTSDSYYSSQTPYQQFISKDITVPVGNWEFTFEGHTDSSTVVSETFDTVYTDTVTKEIVAGENTISFNLKCVQIATSKASGCTILIDLTVPEEIKKVIATVYNANDSKNSESKLTVKNNFVSFKESVSPGKNTVVFKLYGDEKYNLCLGIYREVVNCTYGLTSRAERTITNIETPYNINFELNGADLAEGAVFPSFYSRFSDDIELPTGDLLTKTTETGKELAFSGWYETPDFSTDRITVLESGNTEHKTYYAKWTDFVTISYPDTPYESRQVACDTVFSIKELYPLSVSDFYEVKADILTIEGQDYDDKVYINSDSQIYLKDVYYCCTAENVPDVYALFTEPGDYRIQISGKIDSTAKWKTIRTGLSTKTEGVTLCLDLSEQDTMFRNDSSIKVYAVNSIKLSDKLERIEDKIFEYMYDVDSIEIPASVNYMGYYAFYETNISKLYIKDLEAWLKINYSNSPSYPENVTAYLNGELITEIVIPESIKEINSYAFAWNNEMKVTIPSTVKTINSNAFLCSHITEITLPFVGKGEGATENSKETVFGYIFGSSSYPGVSLPSYQYYLGASSSTSFYIPAIEKITFTGNTLPYGAFSGVRALKEVDLPNIKEIGGMAFSGCYNLKSFTIPETLTKIGASAFANCSNIEALYLEDLSSWFEMNWGNDTTSNPLYASENGTVYVNGEPVTEVTIPLSITEIPKNILYGWNNELKVTVPDTVTSIAQYAFDGCYNIKEITLPFVGKDTSENPGTFGEIFGSKEKTSLNIKTGNTSTGIYYIPAKLEKVTVTGSTLPAKAFYEMSMLKEISLGEKLTSIGNEAFYNCTGLKSISLPETLTTIGKSVFYKDTIETLYLPSMDVWYKLLAKNDGSEFNPLQNAEEGTVYVNNEVLKEINIPETVTQIPSYCFAGWSTLEKVTVPSTVTSIGSLAFSGLYKLKEIELPFTGHTENGTGSSEIFTTIFDYSEKSGLSIRVDQNYTSSQYSTSKGFIPVSLEKVTVNSPSIKLGAFSGCTKIKEISYPNCDGNIPLYAFYNCSSLNKLTLGEKVISSESNAFSGCRSLSEIHVSNAEAFISVNYSESTSAPFYSSGAGHVYCNGEEITKIIIPPETTSISKNAFYGWAGLKELHIPASVTYIGSDAFYKCTSLDTLYLEDVQNFVDKTKSPFTNSGKLYDYNKEEIKTIEISSEVKTIFANHFNGYSNVQNIIIPDSVTSIGSSAFENCTGLETLSIGNGVSTLPSSLLASCINIKEVTVPFIGTGPSSSAMFVSFFYPTSGSSYGTVVPSTLKKITVTKNAPRTGAFKNCSSVEEISLPEGLTEVYADMFSGCTSLQTVNLPSGVTAIGKNAFKGCENLTQVNLTDDVTSIGESAFNGCRNLKPVYLGKGLKTIGTSAFKGCEKFTSVSLPENVTTLDSYAFEGCINLETFKTNESIKSIGSYILKDTNVTSLELASLSSTLSNIFYTSVPSSLKDVKIYGGIIAKDAFKNCNFDSLILGENITAIRTAFDSNSSVKELTIPFAGTTADTGNFASMFTDGKISENIEKVTVLGEKLNENAFKDCTSIKEIVLSDNLTEVSAGAFWNCSAISSITLPESITEIPAHIFDGCSSLTSVSLSSEISSVGDYAFNACSKLKNIPNFTKITSVGDYAFNKCTSLENISVPPTLTSIGSYAYAECSGITSVNVSVETVSDHAFYKCPNLSEINVNAKTIGKYAFSEGADSATLSLGSNVEAIEDYAFSKVKINSLEIPASVTSIGKYAFSETDITSITVPATVETLGAYSFSNCDKLTRADVNCKIVEGCSFYECESLETVVFDVSTIGSNVVNNCRKLDNVEITCDEIKASAFETRGITNKFYGKNVTIHRANVIGTEAFATTKREIKYDGTDDADVECNFILENVTSIGNAAFRYARGHIEVPETVTSFSDYAFLGATALTSLKMSDEVKIIPVGAFSWCTNLTEVVFSSNLTTIKANAFQNTANITTIDIPDTVTYIGDAAFFGIKGTVKLGKDGSRWKFTRNQTGVVTEYTYSETAMEGTKMNGNYILNLVMDGVLTRIPSAN